MPSKKDEEEESERISLNVFNMLIDFWCFHSYSLAVCQLWRGLWGHITVVLLCRKLGEFMSTVCIENIWSFGLSKVKDVRSIQVSNCRWDWTTCCVIFIWRILLLWVSVLFHRTATYEVLGVIEQVVTVIIGCILNVIWYEKCYQLTGFHWM